MAKSSASSPRSTIPRASMSLRAWGLPCRSKTPPRRWETTRFRRGLDMNADGAQGRLEHLLYEVKKVVVGQDYFLERVMVALLAGGHLLVEGVPGLAKTLTVATLAKAMHGSFKRI